VSEKDKVSEDAADEQAQIGGKVYEVDDRFLAVGRPKEQPIAIIFVLLLIAGGAFLWWTGRDSRAFTAAKRDHTAASYQAYVAAWPEGEFVRVAKENVDDLTWEGFQEKAEFEAYLKVYPEGRHARDARTAIDDRNFQQHRYAKTLQQYIDLYPTGRHVQRAKNEIARALRMEFEACTKVCWTAEEAKPEPDRETYSVCCLESCKGHMEEDNCKMGPPPTPEGVVPGAPGAPGAPAPAAPATP